MPALLILDTGSAHTIVQPSLLGKEGPSVAAAHRGSNGAGFVGDAVGHQVRIEVGEWNWDRRAIVVMDLSEVLAAYGEKVDGILGMDFLQEFSSFTVDRDRRIITLKK